MGTKLTITRPDDWHLHVRDGATLSAVVPHTARVFGRAIIMPNLNPPVRTLSEAMAYRERVMAAVPAGSGFEPLMTLYLTEDTTPADIEAAAASGLVVGCKLYPAGATTNSDSGVKDFNSITDTLAAMAQLGMPLLVHGEVVDAHVDIFDREKQFLHEKLAPLQAKLPQLKVVLEHATTKEAVDYVLAHPTVGCTITPQHLLYNRNALLVGGLKPHFYCLPILKREVHREALVAAATSGSAQFFLGTDSAPHAKGAKENACGCAGCFSAHAALPLYAHAFEEAGALHRLEAFASLNGAAFYGRAANAGTVTLERADWRVPAEYPMGDTTVVPLMAGETMRWKVTDVVL